VAANTDKIIGAAAKKNRPVPSFSAVFEKKIPLSALSLHSGSPSPDVAELAIATPPIPEQVVVASAPSPISSTHCHQFADLSIPLMCRSEAEKSGRRV
jgi:hypothetical protein